MTSHLPPPPEPGIPETPPLGFSRLLLVVTGSAAASGVPQWLLWLRAHYTQLHVKAITTRSARRFVTPMSLRLRLGEEPVLDSWEETEHSAHIELAQWAEAALVYPATFHFTARLALGLADTPSLLALHCTDAVIGVAPSLPPGGLDSPAFRPHWKTLAARPNVALIPPIPGYSAATGQMDGWIPPPLSEALRRVEDRRLGREKQAGQRGQATSSAVLADGRQRNSS